MKRIASIILAAVICLSSFVMAYALPLNTPTKVIICTINKKDGAVMIAEKNDGKDHDIPLYEKKTLAYGQEVTIISEQTDPELLTKNKINTESILFAYVGVNYGLDSEYRGFVNIKDITPKEENFNYLKGKKLTYPDTFHVLNGSYDIYAGPSRAYKKLGTIPEGAEFTVTRCDVEEGVYIYGYTEYKGIKGWVFAYPYSGSCSLARIIDEKSYFTGKLTINKKGVKLLDIFDVKDGKYTVLEKEIPVGTDLEYKYFLDMGVAYAAYVEYNGKKGFVYFEENYADDTYEASNCIVYYKDIGYVNRTTPIYSEPDNLDSKTDETIVAHSVFNIDGYLYTGGKKGDSRIAWIKIQTKNKEGWIISDNKTEVYKSNGIYAECTCTEGTIDIYKNPESTADILGSIYSGDIYQMYHYTLNDEGYWNYIVADGVAGWVPDTQNYTVIGGSISHALRLNDDGTVERSVIENIDTGKNGETETEEDTTNEPLENIVKGQKGRIVLGALIAVFILGVAAFGGIMYSVKKRQERMDAEYQKIESVNKTDHTDKNE